MKERSLKETRRVKRRRTRMKRRRTRERWGAYHSANLDASKRNFSLHNIKLGPHLQPGSAGC